MLATTNQIPYAFFSIYSYTTERYMRLKNTSTTYSDSYIRNSEMVAISCVLRRETGAAWLVYHSNEAYWFPKSTCEWNDPDMYVPRWLLIKKRIF